jgi:photosystem II stability/assembly factor-like uncharacterized protein
MGFRGELGKKVLAVLLVCIGIQAANAGWILQKTNTLAWFKDVFFLNEQKGWIVGADGTLLSTTDGGGTWVQTHKFTTDAFLQVYFTDENNGWILCERNVYTLGPLPLSYLRKTTDGGLNWEKIEFEGSGRERVTKLLFNKWGGAMAFGEGGLFYKLQDDGVTWKRSPHATVHFVLLDGAYGDRDIGAISGAGGTIMFTENSGLTWEKASLIGDTDTRLNSIFFAGPKEAWAVGSNGAIFHASGGGRQWRQQPSGTRADLNDLYFTSATNGWVVGDNGIILRTRDSGKTWTDGSSPTTHKLERLTFVGSRGWAVGFGGTILTYNAHSSAADNGRKPVLLKRN